MLVIFSSFNLPIMSSRENYLSLIFYLILGFLTLSSCSKETSNEIDEQQISLSIDNLTGLWSVAEYANDQTSFFTATIEQEGTTSFRIIDGRNPLPAHSLEGHSLQMRANGLTFNARDIKGTIASKERIMIEYLHRDGDASLLVNQILTR